MYITGLSLFTIYIYIYPSIIKLEPSGPVGVRRAEPGGVSPERTVEVSWHGAGCYGVTRYVGGY